MDFIANELKAQEMGLDLATMFVDTITDALEGTEGEATEGETGEGEAESSEETMEGGDQ